MGSLIMNNNISQYVVEHYLENKTLTSWGSEDCMIKGASSQIKLKHMNGKLPLDFYFDCPHGHITIVTSQILK